MSTIHRAPRNRTTVTDLTPQSIPKTILFVDGETKVTSAAQAILADMDWNQMKGMSNPIIKKLITPKHLSIT
jgi:hypothetical protein